MNDLLDLDLSTPAASSSAQAGKGPQAGYGAGKSAFDYLSQMRTTTPSPVPSRSASPYSSTAATSSSTATSNGRLAPSAPTGRPAPPAKATSGAGDDAFSSLFGASPSSSSTTAGGLSMAERLARESAAKIGGVGAAAGGTWSTLSPTSTGGSGSRSSSPALVPSRGASMNSAPTAQSSAAKADPWDFDMLSSAPPLAKPKPASSPTANDPFGLAFDTPPTSRSPAPVAARSNGPHNVFDEDDPFDTSSSLLGGSSSSAPPPQQSTAASSDDFDLLGAFSQPAPPPSRSPAASPGPSQPSRSRTQPPSRASTASPPPHVLGSLIEMGFSIPQSRVALQATASPEGGWNVEAALEALVEEQQVGEARDRRREEEAWGSRLAPREEEDEERRQPSRPRPREQREDPVLEERPATGRRAREAAAAAKAKAEASATQARVQEQANELLAQASKIGFSVFKSANAYWETGKKTVKKVMEEAGEGGAVAGEEGTRQNGRAGKAREEGTAAKGRPKWWTEDMVDEEEGAPSASSSRPEGSSSRRPLKAEQAPTEPPPTLFQDSDHETHGGVVDDVLPQRPSAAAAPQRQPQRPSPPVARPQPPAAEPPTAEYRSPWRRAKASAAAPAPSPPPPAAAPRRRTPTPPPSLPPRPVVSHSPSQLSVSLQHKETGNSHFKLGQFGDADAAYTKAIEALPAGSLVLVPLYNNRASARLRNGDERAAGEDAGLAIEIILRDSASASTLTAAHLAALDTEVLPAEVADLSLKEHLGKALGRRAKALEANEKWDQALADWETLSRGGEVLVKAGGGRKVVSEGVARCRKMLGGAGASAPMASLGNVSAVAARRAQQAAVASTPPRPKPKISASAPVVAGSGDAVRALQAVSAAASAEEDLRLSLKDSVDARITAWKGGKEANLRALIASLENVLWPELEWKKVGMHELISEGQLKVRYVRAIGKVHPDKLAVGNTTVEQRMIAGGVFAGLNDAWNAMKA